LYTYKNKEEIEKNWTILLYEKEDSIPDPDVKTGGSDSDMPMERPPVPGGSRRKRNKKSKKSRRSKKK
jgi:hypothetical protein